MTQKTPTYLDASLADKIQHEDSANAKRVINVDNLVNTYWNRVENTAGANGGITSTQFYLDSEFQKTTITTLADNAGNLNDKYLLLNSAINRTRYYLWFNVDAAGTDPAISGRTGIEVSISAGDSAEIVAAAMRIFINSLASADFTATSSDNRVVILNKAIGAADTASDANTGFGITTDVLGVSTLLLTKSLTPPDGYKYVYNEVEKSFILVSSCLAVDQDNSTATPLLTGEVFYGPWTLRICPEMLVAPYADQDCEIYAQFANTKLSETIGTPVYTAGSASGIDSTLLFEYEAGVTLGTPRRVIVGREYYRVVIVNTSGVDMAALRVQTSIGAFDKLEVKLDSALPLDSDAIVTRSIQTGLDPNDKYVNERQSGYVDSYSTSTPLLAGETYTSPIHPVGDYAQVISEIKSDVDGTISGLWYADAAGTIPLRPFITPYDASEGLSWFATSTLGEYFRITYENGPVDQTEFHLRFKLETNPQTGQMLKLESFVPSNSIVALNRSVIVGKRASDGSYINVGVNDEGALQTSDFYSSVALGNYEDSVIDSVFGRNPDIDTLTDPEDIWNGGGTYTGQPNTGTATTLQIMSSSVLDTSAGTGARTVRIYGLDSDYNEITEDVTLNGLTPVTTVNSYWRQAKAEVLTAGSLGANQGEISSYWTGTPTQIFMVMPIDANKTAIACDTVPAGKKRLILGIRCSMARSGGTPGSANVRLMIRELGGVYNAIRNTEVTESLAYDINPKGGVLIPEKTDIKWQVYTVSDNNTIVTAEFEYIDIDI